MAQTLDGRRCEAGFLSTFADSSNGHATAFVNGGSMDACQSCRRTNLQRRRCAYDGCVNALVAAHRKESNGGPYTTHE